MLEEAYKVQYLYNAINEYLHFSMIFIENHGPQDANELEKFIMFFKKELNCFVEVFKGETKAQKIISLISTVTTAFSIQEEIVSLSKTYKKCKKAIFQELVQSNVTDIVLRGISSIKDVCKCINLNTAIHIEEDVLLGMLKQCPMYHIEDDSSVSILQFTGLIAYDENLYKTITEYFQGYLLKVSSFTYRDINLHNSFILARGIKSFLVILCVFYIDEMFKCKSNKVKISKKWKTRSKNQLSIQMNQLNNKNSKNSVAVSELVFNLYGFSIQSFKGEIVRVNKTMGFIHGILEVHSFVGMFPVFFNMSALNLICGTDNLVDFLSLGDRVEFDAEYCDKTKMQDRYWKASLVKVTKKSALRGNKYQVYFNTEEYIEKRLTKEKFSGVPKSLSPSLDSSNQKLLSHASNLPTIMGSLHSNEEISTDESNTYNFLSSVNHNNEPVNKTENSQTGVSNSCATFEETVEDKGCQIISREDHLERALSEDNHENSPFMPKMIKMDIQELPSTSVEKYLIVKNSSLTESSFMFGEILVITDKEGIATSLSCAKQPEVYFKKQSVLFIEEAKFLHQEGSKVLLFLPYCSKENSISVATLVYVLDEEECSLIEGKYEWVDDFVVEYFIPKLKFMYPNYIDCRCDFGFSFQSPFNSSPHEDFGYQNLLDDLRELFTYNGNTEKNFLIIMKLCLQNSRIDKKKWVSFQAQLFSPMKSKFKDVFSKKILKSRIRCRNMKDDISSTGNENKVLATSSVEEVKTETQIDSYAPSSNDLLSVSGGNSSRNPSPSSLSSYLSCDAVSDEEFFSLESTSSCSTSNVEMKNKSLAVHARQESPVTEPVSLGENTLDVKIVCPIKEVTPAKCKEKTAPTSKHIYRLKNPLLKDNLCKCHHKTVESTASVSMITDSCFFLNVKDNEDVALTFPVSLVPDEVRDQIKLNSELKVTYALHQLVQVSHVLYLKFKCNEEVPFLHRP